MKSTSTDAAVDDERTQCSAGPRARRAAVIYQGCFPAADILDAGQRRARDLARGLQHAGLETTLFCPAHFGADVADASELFAVRHLGYRRATPNARARVAFWRSVLSHVTADHFDAALFYNTTLDSLLAVRGVRNSGVCTAYELCDLFSMVRPGRVRRSFHKLTETWLPRQSDLNVCISTGIERFLHTVAPQTPTTLVPALFDSDLFQKAEAQARNFRERHRLSSSCVLITYSGSSLAIKGLDSLLGAFGRVLTSGADCKLAITGKLPRSPLHTDVETLVRSQGLEANVLRPGVLDDVALADLLHCSDILVCPHLDHEFAEYAFPTKVAEYAACGKAIVTSDVGDIGLYFSDGVDAKLYPPGEVEQLAEALQSLAADEGARRRLGERAAETARRHFDYRENGIRLSQTLLGVSKRELARRRGDELGRSRGA